MMEFADKIGQCDIALPIGLLHGNTRIACVLRGTIRISSDSHTRKL